MPLWPAVRHRLLATPLVLGLAACAVAPSPPRPAGPPPGLNERGEVVDAARVEPGSGQAVRGLGGWEGELVGRPPPGSSSRCSRSA